MREGEDQSQGFEGVGGGREGRERGPKWNEKERGGRERNEMEGKGSERDAGGKGEVEKEDRNERKGASDNRISFHLLCAFSAE